MDEAEQLQIRLVTAQPDFAVPSLPISVPAKIEPDGLQQLVHNLLKENQEDKYDENNWQSKQFQFVVLGDFLRGSLSDLLKAKENISTESAIEITFIEGVAAPLPGHSANHDDWVAGVSVKGDFVLTACYDNTVNIFEKKTGNKKLTLPGHSGPVRDVTWISLNDEVGTFASSSHDQIVMLYQWDIASNSIEVMNACKGHERSVDCLAVSPEGNHIASGSFDSQLKIWGSKLSHDGQSENNESESKRLKEDDDKKKKPVTRTPVITLAGHKEGVSGVDWISNNEVVTASWDHTIKIWDVEMGGMKSELVGNKSFFGISYSPLNQNLITASADSSVRLYDPRAKDGVIVKSQYTSHHGWVTSVCWSKANENHFVSGGHDLLLKLWDCRSYKTPLFDLKGHDDRILCCDWSDPLTVASGGADNTLKLFETKL